MAWCDDGSASDDNMVASASAAAAAGGASSAGEGDADRERVGVSMAVRQVNLVQLGDELGIDKTALGNWLRNATHPSTLNLCRTQVSDVSGLPKCSNLHRLDLSHTPVSDVLVLAACSKLTFLNLQLTNMSHFVCSLLHPHVRGILTYEA